MNNSKKVSFVIYKSFYGPIKTMSNADLGLLFRSIMEYQTEGITPPEDSPVSMAFNFFKNQFDLDDAKYKKTIEKRRKAAEIRWSNDDASASTSIQKNASNADKEKEKENEIYRRFAHLSITNEEIQRLMESWTRNQVDDVLDRIENFQGNKKYKSLYLTALNWLKKEPKKRSKYVPV